MNEDLLDMAYINSLPQPFMARSRGRQGDDWWWPVHDIEVSTGLVRIDVCGLLEVKHLCDFNLIRDARDVDHNPDDFYSDAERSVA